MIKLLMAVYIYGFLSCWPVTLINGLVCHILHQASLQGRDPAEELTLCYMTPQLGWVAFVHAMHAGP